MTLPRINAAEAARGAKTITVRRTGAIDLVTLNRPDRMNTLTQTLLVELLAYFESLPFDPECRVVLLTGAGRAFCAGLDIKAMLSGIDALEGRDGQDTLEPRLFDIIPAMRECPQPIVGLINGPAAGGGLGIALACDIRIASERALFVTSFTRVGLSGCELGVTYFLPRIVGMGIATEMQFTSRPVNAERALKVGLVSEVVAQEQLEAAGEAMARDMLVATPLALRRTKETFNLCLGINDLDAVLKVEGAVQSKLGRIAHDDRLQAFVEKR